MTTDSPPPGPVPHPTASACEPYREWVETALARGRNAMGIWRDLVDQHGFVGAYEAVKRFVRKLRGSHAPEACAVIVTAPGEEAQVDSGTGPMVRDPPTVKYRRTRLFVSTLGCSRKSVRFLAFRSSSQISAKLHERAFRRQGRATRVIVLDHLRKGVAELADCPSRALHLAAEATIRRATQNSAIQASRPNPQTGIAHQIDAGFCHARDTPTIAPPPLFHPRCDPRPWGVHKFFVTRSPFASIRPCFPLPISLDTMPQTGIGGIQLGRIPVRAARADRCAGVFEFIRRPC